jgi:hypothetical protein
MPPLTALLFGGWKRRVCTPKLPTVFCISPTARRYAKAAVQYTLLCFVLIILVLWLGAEYEAFRIRRAESTLKFYQTDSVCGIIQLQNESETPLLIDTFENMTVAEAYPEPVTVAHCGDCGKCSNPHDVNIYDDTKNTLFDTTLTCGKRAFIWGRRTADKCMMENVGFTEPCNECWVENILCDLRYCIFTCIWYGLFNEANTGQDQKTLNPCTRCDELRCGPEFVTCAGVNRRRAGILSDIERDLKNEVCHEAAPNWWKDTVLQDKWKQQIHERGL